MTNALTTYHKQHGEDLTELEILSHGKLIATITVSGAWIDITYEHPINSGSYELLKIEETGIISIDKPTLA
jgi:hypothetical protein